MSSAAPTITLLAEAMSGRGSSHGLLEARMKRHGYPATIEGWEQFIAAELDSDSLVSPKRRKP